MVVGKSEPSIGHATVGHDDASGDLWFLNTRVRVRLACSQSADRISLLEHHAPFGDSPPLHVHTTEDEVFHILDGVLRFRLGDTEAVGRAGDTVFGPKNVPHTYCVESAGGARWLTVTCRTDFERFVRALGRTATGPGLPEAAGPPTPEQAQALTALAHEYGIELVGPPLTPQSSGKAGL